MKKMKLKVYPRKGYLLAQPLTKSEVLSFGIKDVGPGGFAKVLVPGPDSDLQKDDIVLLGPRIDAAVMEDFGPVIEGMPQEQITDLAKASSFVAVRDNAVTAVCRKEVKNYQ